MAVPKSFLQKYTQETVELQDFSHKMYKETCV